MGKLEHLPAKSENEGIYEEIDGLAPKDEGQRGLPLRAMSLLLCMGPARWLIFEYTSRPVATPVLVVIITLGDEHFCQRGIHSPL